MTELITAQSDPRIIEAAAAKREQVRFWLKATGQDGVIISRRDNFAWLTCGGDNRVINSSEIGVGHLVITQNKQYLVSHFMDSDRMMEEQVPGQGYEQVTTYWHQGDERLKAKELAGQRVVADTAIPGTQFAAEQIMDLQWPLNEIEVARTRWLGRNIAEILEKVFRTVEPGMTEQEIQQMLHGEIILRGMDLEVPIVGSDERIHRHRHVLATDKKLERYLLLGPVVRRWGLSALVSRSAHFGEPPLEVQKAFRAAATIEARIISILEEGLKFSKILEYQKQWYEELGVPNGWIYHFQGGPTGYVLVDATRNQTDKVIQAPQPYSWFTTIKGAKVEELTLLTRQGAEIASLGEDWPTMGIDTPKGIVKVPGMLIR